MPTAIMALWDHELVKKATNFPSGLVGSEKADMTNWREIMKLASEAGDLLVRDREHGEKVFESLLKQYPSDGMVYFKRGQAWDATEQYALALSDYRRAARLFRMSEWQITAGNAVGRLEEIVANLSDVKKQSGVLQIEDASAISPDFRQVYEEAFKKIEIDPRASLVLSRTGAEQLADYVLRVNRKIPFESEGFLGKILILRDSRRIQPATISHLHTCRVLGNEAAHGGPVSKEDAAVSWRSLSAITKAVAAKQ